MVLKPKAHYSLSPLKILQRSLLLRLLQRKNQNRTVQVALFILFFIFSQLQWCEQRCNEERSSVASVASLDSLSKIWCLYWCSLTAGPDVIVGSSLKEKGNLHMSTSSGPALYYQAPDAEPFLCPPFGCCTFYSDVMKCFGNSNELHLHHKRERDAVSLTLGWLVV